MAVSAGTSLMSFVFKFVKFSQNQLEVINFEAE